MLSGPTIHELRGAANVLALHLQLLAMEPADDAAIERRRRSLAAADDGRRRLFDIAETFVRHAGLLDASPGEFDLARVADAAIALSRPYALQRRVTVTTPPHGAATTVVGRRDVVAQVLLDLLLDLLDRAPAGGTLALSVGPNGDGIRIALGSPAASVTPDAALLERAEAGMRWAGGTLRTGDGEVAIELPAAPPGDSHEG
jgi:signal transduction histidine kinase